MYIIKTDSMGNVASSTGIADVNNLFVFSVYPNPGNGNFTIALKGIPYNNATVAVYNLYNQKIYSCPVTNSATTHLDLTNAPDGLYVVTLQTKEKVFTQKIIIQK